MKKEDLHNKIINIVSKEVKKSLNLPDHMYMRDAITYEHALTVEIGHNYINEMFHIVDTFMECSKDIIKNIDKFTESPKYSGWIYNREDNQCIQFNVENISKCCVPIYISIIYDDEYPNIMSIQDRDKQPDIISIIINVNKLSDVNNNIAILGHEFRHALEMYVDSKKSHIGDSIINMQGEEFDDNSLKSAFFIARDIVDLFSLSEERARLNGAIHFLKETHYDFSLSDMKYKNIAYLIDQSKNQHLLYNMQMYLDEIIMRNRFGMFDIAKMVGYLWNKYCDKKIKNVNIIFSDLLNDNSDDKEISKNIENFLYANYESFRKRLSDCIATHILIT
ncbi:MAG: hypothetical protein [Wendovervirus sonii]|uniref:Peptidase n=1 Tax=phage Lak_Megaphage_Sonny TaxID=3109229 RepID=A0ABZ0Z2W7_9CAUD|nr:MAG: hypothetical protein [phage Lak_Megaphage_Sonny]